jgi:hypothetical protein
MLAVLHLEQDVRLRLAQEADEILHVELLRGFDVREEVREEGVLVPVAISPSSTRAAIARVAAARETRALLGWAIALMSCRPRPEAEPWAGRRGARCAQRAARSSET